MTKFNVEKTIEDLKNLACKTEYRDGYHLGLNSKDFEEYGLAIEKEFGELIYQKVLEKKPNLILELGTANGYSSCWFLLGLIKNNNGTLITVDRIDRRPKIWEMLDIPTDRLISFYEPTEKFSKEMEKKLDMVFFDTEHRIEQIIKDIKLFRPVLNSGAVLFVHDTYSDPDVGRDLKNYLLNEGVFDYESIDKSCGLGIATYKGEK